MKFRPGQQVASVVDGTRMIVVRAPAEEAVLTCGGAEMVDAKQAPAPGGAPAEGAQEGTVLGKRYADEALGIELLCTKPGEGTVAVNGVPLVLQGAKPLPASD
jgi:alcohol dehydrogenase YqhD (iron-dependent ADH family)